MIFFKLVTKGAIVMHMLGNSFEKKNDSNEGRK